jgi:predicted phage terminase large subunit-like protein
MAAKIGLAKAIDKAERSELVTMYEQYAAMGREWLRRQILVNNRIDILAEYVLGYQIKPLHLSIMKYQFAHRESLQLVFRGAGKSSCGTVGKALHIIAKDPNVRILIASKTSTQAEAFLKEIKGHLEVNDKYRELFGVFYDPRRVNKWDSREIEVLPRTRVAKEATITCVGFDGMIVGKHYEVILSDDLVDEDNTRTKLQRDKMRTWYYQSLDPTLEPPSPDHPHCGEHHRLGTRYHYDDLYGHLIENELKDHHQVIPALSPEGRSPWPEKFPPKWFAEKRKKSGLIIFNSQYQCDTEAMKGEVFQYDDCQRIAEKDYPPLEDMQVFMGVDLAISEKSTADMFAVVVIGVTADRNIYVLDFYEGQLRFLRQTRKILELFNQWDPIRVAIETNAYQESQKQLLEDAAEIGLIESGEENVLKERIKGVEQEKDKMTRAWKLSAKFENKKVFFKTSQHALINHLVLFPNFRYKDLFDAFDMAVGASKVKRKKKARREPGLF